MSYKNWIILKKGGIMKTRSILSIIFLAAFIIIVGCCSNGNCTQCPNKGQCDAVSSYGCFWDTSTNPEHCASSGTTTSSTTSSTTTTTTTLPKCGPDAMPGPGSEYSCCSKSNPPQDGKLYDPKFACCTNGELNIQKKCPNNGPCVDKDACCPGTHKCANTCVSDTYTGCCLSTDGSTGVPYVVNDGSTDNSQAKSCCQTKDGSPKVYNPYSECCECPPANDPNPFHPSFNCYWNIDKAGTKASCNICPNGLKECVVGTHANGVPQIQCYDESRFCCHPCNNGYNFVAAKETSAPYSCPTTGCGEPCGTVTCGPTECCVDASQSKCEVACNVASPYKNDATAPLTCYGMGYVGGCTGLGVCVDNPNCA